MKGDIGMALKFKSKNQPENLTGIQLEYYILTMLSFRGMYEQEILDSIPPKLKKEYNINQSTLSNILYKLENDGKITIADIRKGHLHTFCSITNRGQQFLDEL